MERRLRMWGNVTRLSYKCKYNLESDFLAVPLGGIDVVLGIQWLQTLGTYSTNHQEHFIEFHEFGKTHKLYGYQPPPTQLVTSHQMENLR